MATDFTANATVRNYTNQVSNVSSEQVRGQNSSLTSAAKNVKAS